jgi:ABC-type Fe3+ transport system permease subunit
MNRNEEPLYNEEQLHTLQNNSRHRREERNESIRGWFKSILWVSACGLAIILFILTISMMALYGYYLFYGVQSELINQYIENWFKFLFSAGVGILSKDKVKDVYNKS